MNERRHPHLWIPRFWRVRDGEQRRCKRCDATLESVVVKGTIAAGGLPSLPKQLRAYKFNDVDGERLVWAVPPCMAKEAA